MASVVAVLAAAASCWILLAASVSSAAAVPVVYSVGDERGWTKPSGNGTETYNHWAKKIGFQVGDVLDFKYANDSVLLVSHDEYKQCSTEHPVSRFTDGDTKFKLDRAGLFYFISGTPRHCEEGQRMIVRVEAHSSLTGGAAPARAPASLGGASSPVISSPEAPSYGSGSGSGSGSSSSSSSSPSPLPSGASRRALTAGFSVVIGLLVLGVITMLSLA